MGSEFAAGRHADRAHTIKPGNSWGTIQRTVAAIDSDVSVGEIEPVPTSVAKILAYPRFRAITLATFAVLAVLLSSVGLYGALWQFVVQRTPEIGVRMAMGARPSDVLRLIGRQAGGPLAAGLALASRVHRYSAGYLRAYYLEFRRAIPSR